jgi:hypothetical protein
VGLESSGFIAIGPDPAGRIAGNTADHRMHRGRGGRIAKQSIARDFRGNSFWRFAATEPADKPGQPALARTRAPLRLAAQHRSKITGNAKREKRSTAMRHRHFAASTDFNRSVGGNFKQPKEGLGLDNSPSAHMDLSPSRFL